MSDFVSALQQMSDRVQPNVSVTENGAIGYKTAGKSLIDLNFMLSSMRNMTEDEIWLHFVPAYNENPELAIIWLFFARDREDGCGERRTFRAIFRRLCYENDAVAIHLLKLIPFYGRWDDLTDVFFGEVPCNIRDEALRILYNQIGDDLDSARAGKPVSLLAKWLPSSNTSSRETRRRAEELRNAFGWSPKQYRKTLSRLRAYLHVVEQKMSSNNWEGINYETVPSRAAMNYREAFTRHDFARYEAYLQDVKEGKAKINAGVLFPHDIVHAYYDTDGWRELREYNPTLEAQWISLPNKVPPNESTLVVVDGSGSMSARVGNTGISCHDVARALGIYFSEKLNGPYRDTFVTFSRNPRLVRFDDAISLNAKLKLFELYDECENTNIEKVFDLVLRTAVENHLSQNEIPANILILSDMEFDEGTYNYGSLDGAKPGPVDQALFDQIACRWEAAGYKLPRLVFWNICSRTKTIPVTTNELGVALVSGFSPSIADMVMSTELDPYKCLTDKLMSDRYIPVRSALKE